MTRSHSRTGNSIATSAVLLAWAAVAGLVPVTGLHAQPPYAFPPADRVVVIGDVHGAYDAMAGILEATGIIDADGHWSGGDTSLVSLGDLLDRGPDSRAAMDLLMRLEAEAPAAGGRVHVVLGNHEHMNLIGDLRYVSAGEYAAFAADETDIMRDAAFATWSAEQPDPTAATREQFDARFPAGYFAHREAFSPTGRYGEWLLGLPAVITIGETVFVHGGLSPTVGELGLDATNTELRDEIGRYFELRANLAAAGALPAFDTRNDMAYAQQALAREDIPPPAGMDAFLELGTGGIGGTMGPLWYRGSVYCKPLLERPVLDAALAALGAARVVVGHTPTDNRRAQVRHDGRLIMLDTGMLASYYDGTASALILDGGDIRIRYQGDAEAAPLDLGRIAHAYGLTEAELVTALTRGTIVGVETAPEGGPQTVGLEFEGTALRARFVPHDANGRLALAAARLDDLIGAEMVAPGVEREINGVTGTLELVYADSVSEAARLGAGQGLSGFCPIEPQLHLMYAFDSLIENAGRTQDNILFVDDISELLLSGHTSAFGTGRNLAPGLDPTVLRIPAVVIERLRALDEGMLETELAGLLDRRQIRALLSRRDKLIAGR